MELHYFLLILEILLLIGIAFCFHWFFKSESKSLQFFFVVLPSGVRISSSAILQYKYTYLNNFISACHLTAPFLEVKFGGGGGGGGHGKNG